MTKLTPQQVIRHCNAAIASKRCMVDGVPMVKLFYPLGSPIPKTINGLTCVVSNAGNRVVVKVDARAARDQALYLASHPEEFPSKIHAEGE
jgi:hypothetical protein